MSQLDAFAARAVRRKGLFLALSVAGVLVGLGLALYFWISHEPGDPTGLQTLVVVLVLLNARGNLRQVRYVRALEALSGDATPSDT